MRNPTLLACLPNPSLIPGAENLAALDVTRLKYGRHFDSSYCRAIAVVQANRPNVW